MFALLDGEGTLRVAGEMIAVRAGDVIDIPPDPEYPHHIINTGTVPLRDLPISTQNNPEVCEYPGSGKCALYTRKAAGLVAGRRRGTAPRRGGVSPPTLRGRRAPVRARCARRARPAAAPAHRGPRCR